MFDPVNRREFLERAAAVAVTSVGGRLALLAADPSLAHLTAYIDPIILPDASPDLSDEENAFPLLKQAAEGLTERPFAFLIGDCRRGNWLDTPREEWIDPWLDENQQAIALIKQAVRRGKLDIGTTVENLDTVTELRSLCVLLQLSAQRFTANGKLAEAAAVGQTMSQAFRLLVRGGGFPFPHLSACWFERDSWKVMTHIAMHSTADAKLVRSLLASLPPRNDNVVGMRNALRAECCGVLLPLLDGIDDSDLDRAIQRLTFGREADRASPSYEELKSRRDKFARLFLGHPKPLDRVDTVNRASARWASLIRELDVPWPLRPASPSNAGEDGELAPWPEHLNFTCLGDVFFPCDTTDAEIQTARDKLLHVENPIGRKFLDAGFSDKLEPHRVTLGNQMYYDRTRLVLAVRVFQLEHGELPGRLDALVDASLLDTLPPDPFSTGPFQYSAEEGLIWSIGPDGTVSPSAPSDDPDSEYYIWRLDAARP